MILLLHIKQLIWKIRPNFSDGHRHLIDAENEIEYRTQSSQNENSSSLKENLSDKDYLKSPFQNSF
jgi:hypothetical protein